MVEEGGGKTREREGKGKGVREGDETNDWERDGEGEVE